MAKWMRVLFALTLLLWPSAGWSQAVAPSEGRPAGGISCAYNSILPGIGTIPGIPDGSMGIVQCDSAGRLIIANPGSGGSTGSTGSSTFSTPAVSGTGGDSPATLGTSPVTAFLPAPAAGKIRQAIFVSPQLPPSSSATITLCKAATGITPAPGVAGCYTIGAGGSIKATPLGYVPQDSWNAVASAPNVPVTITLIDK